MSEYIKPIAIELEPVGGAEMVCEGVTCLVLQNPNDERRDWGLLEYQPRATTAQLMVAGKVSKEIWISGPMTITRVRGGVAENFVFPGCETTTVSIEIEDQIIMRAGDASAIVLEEVWPAWNILPDRYKTIG